jgi:glycosyltransferase involved in cell wall biosynthesis
VPQPAELLGRAHIVALPSRWEAFGLVAVEAMAASRAVLASRVDGLPEVVGEAGLLLPPDDVRAWRQALAGLAADPQRRAALGQAARARSLHFDIARTAEAHWALYRRLCAPRPA